MDYSIVPIGGIWVNGAFNVPLAVVDKYIRLASEYQLKALLIILSTNGKSSSAEIAKKLGITSSDAEEIMEFWLEEGAVAADGMEVKPSPAPIQEEAAEAEKPSKKFR